MIVADVEPGSVAEGVGLFPGDVIVEVNHQPEPNLKTYQQVASPIKPKQALLLLINRQGALMYVGSEGG